MTETFALPHTGEVPIPEGSGGSDEIDSAVGRLDDEEVGRVLRKLAEEESKSEGVDFVGDLDEYVKGKAPDNHQLQQGIKERVRSFQEHGSSRLQSELDELQSLRTDEVVDFQAEDAEFSFESQKERIIVFTREQLKNQEFKQQKLEFFVTKMLRAVHDLSNEIDDPKEKQELLSRWEQVIAKATDAILVQDQKATSVTLGDHGFMHLVADFRDAQRILEAQRGQPLSSEDILLLGLASAYHDIGYASPEVNGLQKEDPRFYSVDKGHPVLSAAFVLSQKEEMLQVLSEEEFQALYHMVITHENPDRAHKAGRYSDLALAFSLADAAAAYGVDKLPPSMQEEEVVAYVALLGFVGQLEHTLNEESVSLARDETKSFAELTSSQRYLRLLLDELEKRRQNLVQHASEKYTTEYATAFVNSLDHYSSRSIGFVLGRIAGERSSEIYGDNGYIVIETADGIGRGFDQSSHFTGAAEAARKYVIKMIDELGALKLSKEEKQAALAFLSNPEIDLSQEYPNVDLSGKLNLQTRDDGKLELTAPERKVKILFEPDRVMKSDGDYVDRVTRVLDELSKRKDSLRLLSFTPSG